MSNFFYPKLAVTGIKKNGKFYIPYILTCAGMIAMFYIMCAITYNKGMDSMPDSSTIKMIMGFGIGIIAIFSAIFLFYTNSFLIKRRKKELGLYNILGMEKRHIGKVLFYETVVVFFISSAIGIISGIVLNKLMLLILYKMLNFSVSVKFSISAQGIAFSLILFAGIFLLLLLFNFMQLKLSNPIELLHGSNTGEKEPKTKIVMTILGVLCLGTGYTIAIITKNPIQALTLFFIAVVLVIIGTYFLFIAGSIALLKLMKKNKKYYYKQSHFISVSGMIYRMKQNAAGLASICILSTMVLVLVSTTVSLNVGMKDIMDNRYPNDIEVILRNPQGNEEAEALQKINEAVKNNGRNMSNFTNYKHLQFSVHQNGSSFESVQDVSTLSSNVVYWDVMKENEYNNITGNNISLGDNEIAISEKNVGETVNVLGEEFKVSQVLKENPLEKDYYVIKQIMVVVKDDTVLNHLFDLQNKIYAENASSVEAVYQFDLDGTNDQIISCYNDIVNATAKQVTTTTVDENGNEVQSSYLQTYSECKQDSIDSFYALYGGLLFLGLFLGFLFLIATVLIIYYKQISEGYEDKKRFEIMQKVGMSNSEIMKSINSQVLSVFFIPIIMASVHILAAFKMISRLLALFNLTNVPLFAVCTLVCIIVFAVIYTIVYMLTSRIYYKIVK